MNDKHDKLYFLIGYDDGVAFMSLPTYETTIDLQKLITDYRLKSHVSFNLEEDDKFIGW